MADSPFVLNLLVTAWLYKYTYADLNLLYAVLLLPNCKPNCRNKSRPVAEASPKQNSHIGSGGNTGTREFLATELNPVAADTQASWSEILQSGALGIPAIFLSSSNLTGLQHRNPIITDGNVP